MKRLVTQLSQTAYVRNALHDVDGMAVFHHRPSSREIVGLAILAFSYVIGWPMVATLGALAIYFDKPALGVIGGPLTYALSHLVFLLGMYLAGARYCAVILRQLTRIVMLKLMRITCTPAPAGPQDPPPATPN